MSSARDGELANYRGVLQLDDDAEQSSLRWQGDDGEVHSLIQFDPEAAGDYDPSQVIAAWYFFSEDFRFYSGRTVAVRGFIAGDGRRLHMLEASV